MSEIGLRTRMLVKDVMSSPVVITSEDATANKVAKLMLDNKVGCIVITGKDERPLGIVTERDLVARVLAKNISPEKTTAKEFMSSPLITIEPDTPINEAAKRMRKRDIRRLAVLYKNNLVGIVSSKDILDVMPELIEIIQERTRIEGASTPETSETREESSLEGYCDRCGVYSENLKDVNGQNLCDDCRLEEETKE
jgi:CBS domain-containing protein